MSPIPQAPPALATPAPAERELGIAGFNLLPLRASVLAGEGPWFAVLVAGAGAMDRNWSSPQLPPGKAGRDFALWLRDQKLGSLRYDKRFIGAKDPKLDISLDAQLGDLKAVLKGARQLPEAKGRKVLLVGHSEGAMLSLLVGGEADAILLLEPPAQTLAKTLLGQIKAQLPEERAGANLAYLEEVFNAIRAGRPTPGGGPEVFPELVRMAQGLMRPESLDFVRATLDLDPWLLASRLGVPCAAAWGDRDIYTWRPEKVPASFPGKVIDLPEANHLLRRETRPRTALNGATAPSAYGGDTPMADLAPLAAWIRSLP